MPRNAAGAYTLPPTVNPVVTDTLITTNWGNTTLADIQLALTDSLDRNGRGGMLAPFKLSDGSVAAPGIAFTNESTTGFARTGTGQMSTSVQGTEVMRFLLDRVTFLKSPQYAADPTVIGDLVNLGYLQNTYAPLLNPTFSAAGFPKWAGVPVAASDLVNKNYADALAFAAALPAYAAQPTQAQLQIEPDGTVGWTMELAAYDALSTLTFIGA